MKLKPLLTTALMAMAIICPGFATETNDDDRTVPIIPKKNPKERPKAPSRQQISCVYNGETMTINFLIDEGNCTLTINNIVTGEESLYTFDSAYLAEITVGELTKAYLEIQTESGHTYYGELSADIY